MTPARQRIFLGLLALTLGCDGQLTDVDRNAVSEAVDFKKGGKPGGPGSSFGEPIIAHSSNRDLWLTDTQGNSMEILAQEDVPPPPSGGSTEIWNMSWAPDGSGTSSDPWRMVFTTFTARELYRIDIDTVGGSPRASVPQRLVVPEGGLDVGWSPDGTALAWTEWSSTSPNSSLWIGDAPDGMNAARHASADNITWMTWSADSRWVVYKVSGEASELRAVKRSTGEVVTVLTQEEHQAAAGVSFDRWGGNLDFSRAEPYRISFWAQEVLRSRNGKSGLSKLENQIHVMEVAEVDGILTRMGDPIKIVSSGAARGSWAPDDSKLVFIRNGLELYDFATGDSERFAAGGSAASTDWRKN